jgi:MFS family permease
VFLPAVYGFFIARCCCSTAVRQRDAGRGMAFFLWIAVFNLFAVAVFWSFMADVFSNAEARKFYGYIGAAGTVGAFLGPVLTRTLVERIGIANLMLVSAVSSWCAWYAAAPAPVGGGARAGAQGHQRRDADGGRSAGRTEADRGSRCCAGWRRWW